METVNPGNLGQAFAVWAAVVGLIGCAVVYELARVRSELKAMSLQLNTYVVTMERRVTTIETHLRIRQGFRPHHQLDDDPADG